MVRILNRLGVVEKDLKKHYDEKHMDFKIGTISGSQQTILSDEKVNFKKGDIFSLKIKEINITPNTIFFISGYASNAYGYLAIIGEEVPLPVSLNRHADYATFVALKDGSIEKDDLLGTIILLPIESI